jgi:hypothetical protein
VDEVIVKLGVSAAVPVPVSVTVCGDPEALSATESVAEKLVTDAGVNVTDIEQLEPAARELPQVFVWLKSLGLTPVTEMPVIANEAFPVFIRVAI